MIFKRGRIDNFLLFKSSGAVFWKHGALSEPMSEVEIMHVNRLIHRRNLGGSSLLWAFNLFSKRVFSIMMMIGLFKLLNLFRQIVAALLLTSIFEALHPFAGDLALFYQIFSPAYFALLCFNVESAAWGVARHQHPRNLNLQEWYLLQPLVEWIDEFQSWIQFLCGRLSFQLLV